MAFLGLLGWALVTLCICSLTSKPDEPTFQGGLVGMGRESPLFLG